MALDVSKLKDAHRATWNTRADRYQVLVDTLGVTPVMATIVDRVGIEPGMEVLDAATGTGTVALAAARRGARVTALDLSPELLAIARSRGEEAGLEVEWVEGDAEDLPFDDGRFDRVVSTIGVQFAPRHEVIARELARVCRPGGEIGLYNWTREGYIGRLWRLIGEYSPPPPDFASPPEWWGDEEHVRRLFADAGVELEFERDAVHTHVGSIEEFLQAYEVNYGPVVLLKERLGREGRWDEFRSRWRELPESMGTTGPDGFRIDKEFLFVRGRKR